ncbi:MAG: type II secretion system F family protein [Acidimicrobiales bacterium]
MTGLALILGLMFAGLGILTYRLLFPAPPPLKASLDRLYKRDELVRISDIRRAEGTDAASRTIGESIGRVLKGLGLRLESLEPDLRLMGRSVEQHLGLKVLFALLGLVFPQLMFFVLGTGGTVPLIVTLALAVMFFFVPDLTVRAEAERKRKAFRHALGSFLDLVVISLAGGAGVEGALRDSAAIGHGWAFNQLRSALEVTQLTGETPWASLARLGEELGVDELTELAASVSLAGTEGAKVRESLAVKAISMRDHALTAEHAEAESATERMSVPLTLLFFGFLVLIGFPALAIVGGS